jgi:poly(A) polymerase
MEVPLMWTPIERPLPTSVGVRQILSVLGQNGHEAYIVGGAVRDFLLGRKVKDLDLVTDATPDRVAELFPKTLPIGKAYGVMKVQASADEWIEVATFRSDGVYVDSRHPTSVRFGDIQADSERRDFTVNALYYDIKQQRVLDLHQGLEDLRSRTLRTVGAARLRFKEDALRLLRAVRFACELNFEISDTMRTSMVEAAPLLSRLSAERVREELDRMWLSQAPDFALESLKEYEFLPVLFPEWCSDPEFLQRSFSGVKKLMKASCDAHVDLDQAWSLLFLLWYRTRPHALRVPDMERPLKKFKFSNERSDRVLKTLEQSLKFRETYSMRDATLYRWLSEPEFDRWLQFHRIEAMATDGNLAAYELCASLRPEAVARAARPKLLSGEDLKDLGFSPGPKFSAILKRIEDLTLEGTIHTKDEAVEVVLQEFVG